MAADRVELPCLLVRPVVPESCFVDRTARINGDVVLGEQCSIWFHAAIRGDVNTIRVGARTSIQDGCVLHTTFRKHPLSIGDDVVLGHGAIVHGCTLGSRVLVGMGAIVLDGAVVENDVILGARALVTEGKVIPKGTLALGQPARVVRELTPEEIASIADNALRYTAYVDAYRRAGRFHGWREHPDFAG